jgi:hypothetical protein
MVLWYFRKQAAEKWAHHTGKKTNSSSPLSYPHQAEPQRHDTGKAQGDFKSKLGVIKRDSHNPLKNLCIFKKNEPDYGNHKGY